MQKQGSETLSKLSVGPLDPNLWIFKLIIFPMVTVRCLPLPFIDMPMVCDFNEMGHLITI